MEEIEITPKSENTEKVQQSNLGLSLAPSDPNAFPIVYSDNVWDIAESGSKLAELLNSTGQFDQHTINEFLAKLIIEGYLGISFNNDFNDDFGY